MNAHFVAPPSSEPEKEQPSHDAHKHEHEHEHRFSLTHHHHIPPTYGKLFALGITLNLAYVGAETLWGIFAHSLALLADAGHNLSDVLALGAAWIAQILSKRKPSARYTYGLRRSSILASLGNAILLLMVTGAIVWEALQRLFHPEPVASLTIIIIAGLGIVINGGTALLFLSGQKEDINIRGAFLHMASDALMAAAVVITGIVIYYTGWLRLDPLISLAVSAAIVIATWSLLRQSLDMALDAVPAGINTLEVESFLRNLPGVTDVHDLHIWPMSTTETALTAHVIHPEQTHDGFLAGIADELRERFKIGHATVQVETQNRAFSCTLHPDSSV